MVGAAVMKVARHMLLGIRRPLDLRRPFFDHSEQREATHVLSIEYGRFHPDAPSGEESIWASDQFLVAQIGEHDVYQKEPTVRPPVGSRDFWASA